MASKKLGDAIVISKSEDNLKIITYLHNINTYNHILIIWWKADRFDLSLCKSELSGGELKRVDEMLLWPKVWEKVVTPCHELRSNILGLFCFCISPLLWQCHQNFHHSQDEELIPLQELRYPLELLGPSVDTN